MSQKITFHSDGATALRLSAISVSAYTNAALTTPVTLPFAVTEGTVVYVSDSDGQRKIFVTVTTSRGVVVHYEDVTPATSPENGAHVVVRLSESERAADVEAVSAAGGGATSAELTVFYTGGAYPLRNTVTSSSTTPVTWDGPVKPTIGGGYMLSIDKWKNTGAYA